MGNGAAGMESQRHVGGLRNAAGPSLDVAGVGEVCKWRVTYSRRGGEVRPSATDSPPPWQQGQRVVALDPVQVGIAEAEFTEPFVVFPPEAEREIGAPQDLRDR